MTRVSWILGGAVVGLGAATLMRLVPGAAPVPDSPSQARLDALQGQVSQLSQETRALRSLLLLKSAQQGTGNVDSASGSERPREPPRESGPPESPEEARARSEAARAEQERHVANGHASETRDAAWSHSFEPQLRKALFDSLASDGELVEIDCAAISCRAKLSFEDEALRSGALTRVRDLPELAPETLYFYQKEGDKFAVTLFIAREGHSLVAQYLSSLD